MFLKTLSLNRGNLNTVVYRPDCMRRVNKYSRNPDLH